MARLSLLFILTCFTFNLTAQNDKYGIDQSQGKPEGLETGAVAPEFEGMDVITGKTVSLKNLLENGPVVIMFYRGQWCPVCNRHLSNVADSLDLIREKGATLIAIAPETTENARETVDKTDLSAIVINDTSGKIMEDYRVKFKVTKSYQRKMKTVLFADIAKNNAQEEAELPVPATYIIGTNGKIIWRHFDPNYKNRASVKAIVEQL